MEQVDPNAGDGRQAGSDAEYLMINMRHQDTETQEQGTLTITTDDSTKAELKTGL